jgi:20S proteasome alpha/beta subunit
MKVHTIYKTTNLARKHPSMTCILGAKCNDGVVLIADSKFTVTGKHPVYDDKITGEVPGILTAFSGSREPFEEFRMRFRDYVVTAKEQNKEITIDRILINIGNIMGYLYSHYSNYEFDLLLAMTAKPSFLYYFYQDGRPRGTIN